MSDADNVANKADLLIIMGTALAVSPFNMLPQMMKKGVPKVLFNMENTKETGGQDFTEKDCRKLFVQGKCDETIAKLCADIGWTEEFRTVLPDVHKGKEVPAKI
jgi:NAD-dependent SIR2 family protein deacetylase